MNLSVPAVAVREFKLDRGHGYSDYLLFLDGRAVGVCEAKPAGVAVRNVEVQAKKYVEGLPDVLDAPYKPLPFAYISTGEETAFINHSIRTPERARSSRSIAPKRCASG